MASNRLTKTTRQEIVDAVMKATTIEAQRADISKRASELATQIISQKIPPELMQAVKKYPREWFKWVTESSLPYRINPLAVDGRCYANSPSFVEALPYANEQYTYTDAEKDQFLPLRAEAEALEAMKEEMRRELGAFLESCTTVDKVLERMPELEPYIPKESKSFPIVASTGNLLSALMKAGFIVQPVAHV